MKKEKIIEDAEMQIKQTMIQSMKRHGVGVIDLTLSKVTEDGIEYIQPVDRQLSDGTWLPVMYPQTWAMQSGSLWRSAQTSPKLMLIPFPGGMDSQAILCHLKTAVEILMEGDEERIQRVIENPNDAVGPFLKHISRAIKGNPTGG